MALNLSLRTKGVLALSVLILYVAAVGWFVAYERQKLLLIVQQIETNSSDEALLAPAFNMLAHSLVAVQATLNAPQSPSWRAATFGDLATQVEAMSPRMQEAGRVHPELTYDIVNFMQAVAAVGAVPSDAHLEQVRDSEQALIVKLHEILTALQKRNAELTQKYHQNQQSVSVVSYSANIVAAVGSMAVILIFFTRLTTDIKRLQQRAVAIVGGYAGEPLRNTRRDEFGGLINAVNRMQVDLRRWEQQLEIARQQRFHQEKMAAVGSMAAAIGHEVSNPIAAISGVAQFMVDETREKADDLGRMVNEYAAQILKQTERIGLIMRQMATLTAPRSPQAELLDVNALIRSTCDFVRFDRRFQGIACEQHLDHELPAITAVADHLTQVLMNLLINAADAMDHLAEAGEAKIRITTRTVDGEVHIAVTDNGHGMSPEVMAQAFDDSFTTKPAGKGRGIGLFICKTLVEEAGGRIALASTPDVGTTVNLYLPMRPPGRAAD